MNNFLASLLVFSLFLVFMGPSTAFASEQKKTESDSMEKAAISKMVELYRDSVIHADDLTIAEKVWANTKDISFIHPRGHELGWEQIKENFYTKTMNNLFATRDLKVTNTPQIVLYGNTAVVEFTWEFLATTKLDGSQRKTEGRESQVFVKLPDLGWRLVQVHYSAPPAS